MRLGDVPIPPEVLDRAGLGPEAFAELNADVRRVDALLTADARGGRLTSRGGST